MNLDPLLLNLIFFVIAIVYASAGFGGGSSYLAILALAGLGAMTIKPNALLCNITVVSFSTLLFYKHKLIPFKRLFPLIITSIPMAYIGGRILLDTKIYFSLLAILLIIAAFIMLVNVNQYETKKLPKYSNALLGGSIGFISGLIGIGGGIFLTPILHLVKWGKPKAIAATASVYILVNSTSGLAGQVSVIENQIEWRFVLPLMLSVFLGGQIGSRLTIFKLDQKKVKFVTALLILFIGIRLFITHLF